MIDHLKRYAGAYARGFTYALISGLTVWSTAIGDKSGQELFETLEQRWPALLIASVIAIATVIRAQLDQHIARVPPAEKPTPTPPV